MSLADYWRSPLDPERVMHASVTHWHEHRQQLREDALAVEEPLEVRLNHRSLAIIMRTPGNDVELAMGFLLTEGVIARPADVLSIEEEIDDEGLPLPNVLNVRQVVPDSHTQQESGQGEHSAFERHFAVSASCGLCGKNRISDLLISTSPLEESGPHIAASTLYELPDKLRTAQSVFAHTGGLHAAGLFKHDGSMVLLREDIGRHNAVDKLIGHGLLQGKFPYEQYILLVSGRTSFEIIQKALIARIPYIVAISAPSSLAVELADRSGITLVGFLREYSMNVYTHPERIE